MRKLDKTDSYELQDRWIFMDIAHFFSDVDAGGITDYDGQGQYVYADNKCNLYVDEDNYISFSELAKYTYWDMDKFIDLKSDEKYHLIGVFWFNK